MKGYTEIPFMQMGFFREKKRSIGNRFSIVTIYHGSTAEKFK